MKSPEVYRNVYLYSDIIFIDNMPTTAQAACYKANSNNEMRLIKTLSDFFLWVVNCVTQADVKRPYTGCRSSQL